MSLRRRSSSFPATTSTSTSTSSSNQVTMASTSTSNRHRRKSRKSKFVPKPKQVWRVKQPTRNWLELPSDLMVNILQRIGVHDILENAQKVCTAWRELCKDPALWRVIYMDNFTRTPRGMIACQDMCKHVVDRSQGQMLDLTMIGFCNPDLLQYVADRLSHLKHLQIVCYFDELCGVWSEALKKLPLLEELNLVRTNISKEDIEAAGRYCPLLKTLKVNQKTFRSWHDDEDDIQEHEEAMIFENELAFAIGKNLPGLTHLELIGNHMTNVGLQTILDGCCRLESLDLRGCLYLDLKGDLGKRCSQQIKHLKLPRDSVEGWPHIYETWSDDDDDDDDYDGDEYLGHYNDFYNGYSDYDYDDYRALYDDGETDLENLSEMMAFMAMFG